jgi:beta-N-acetylhexosaminidase
VKEGKISMKRLDESVLRVLKLKKKRGIFKRRLVTYDSVVREGNYNPVHEQVTERIAREAVTLVRNHGDMLPLGSVSPRRVVVMTPSGEFANRVGREKTISVVRVPSVPSRTQREEGVARVLRAAQGSDGLVLVAVNRYHVSMIRQIVEKLPDIPTAFISFASPYYLSSVPSVDAYVCTYSYSRVAQVAAAQALLGETRMTGRLPVSIPGFYAYGHRVEDRIVALPALQ